MSAIQSFNCTENLVQQLAIGARTYNLTFTTEEIQTIASTALWSMSKDSSVRGFHNQLLDRTINQIYPNPTPKQANNIFAYIEFVATFMDQHCQENNS